MRGVDVLTAQEDDTATFEDAALLDRVMETGRILFTQDDDFLSEAARRQEAGQPFPGILYAHQLRISIGQCIRHLELIAELGEPDEMMSRVLFVPL